MASVCGPTPGKSIPSLKNYSPGKKHNSRECPSPLRGQTEGEGQISKWREGGRLALKCCATDETEKLPRIVLVASGDGLMQELHHALNPCPLEIQTFTKCREAVDEIQRHTTADVIFTDLQLFDGDWRQVLRMAKQSAAPAQVVVVSRYVDVPLYLDALEAGVFDVVVPPFRTVEIGCIVVNAIYACFKGRGRRLSKSFLDERPA